MQLDLTANFLYDEKFTSGLGYSTGSSISTLMGFQVSDELFVGYSYDINTNRLGGYGLGSHEIVTRFDLFTKNRGRKDCTCSYFF